MTGRRLPDRPGAPRRAPLVDARFAVDIRQGKTIDPEYGREAAIEQVLRERRREALLKVLTWIVVVLVVFFAAALWGWRTG